MKTVDDGAATVVDRLDSAETTDIYTEPHPSRGGELFEAAGRSPVDFCRPRGRPLPPPPRGSSRSCRTALPQRVFDVNVSVQRYGAQVEYGRGGAHHVNGRPYVAKLGAEHPVALQVVDQRERHDQRADEQVRDGQRGEEQVADPPQSPVRVDGHAHQHVAGDRQEDEDDQEGPCGTWCYCAGVQ